MDKKVNILIKDGQGFLDGDYTEEELQMAYLALRSKMVKDSPRYLHLLLEEENQLVVEGTLVEDELVLALKAVMTLIARELVNPEDLISIALNSAIQTLDSEDTEELDGVQYEGFGEVDLRGLS